MTPTIELSAEHMQQMTQHLEAAYPFEGCGIILGTVHEGRQVAAEILPADNDREAEAQHNRYNIPPEKLLRAELRAEELGLQVIGYFHSHPDHPAEPSEFDREHAWPWYSYLIAEVRQGQAILTRSWRLLDDRSGFVEERIESHMTRTD